jgi:hypothetical protein
MTPENERLLARRHDLQAKIDGWRRANPAPLDASV